MPERGLSGPTAAAPPRRRRAAIAPARHAAGAAGRAQAAAASEERRDAGRAQRFYAALRAANPQPRTELEYRTPFELLVAVILSAQATDRSVNAATRALFRVAPTPQAMLDLGLAGLKRHIARSACTHQGETRPRDRRGAGRTPRRRSAGERAALEALPGVGRKTANVVLNTAFGQPTIAVDTHIFRVANRTGLAPGKTPREVEDGTAGRHATRIRAQRASLADPAGPLRLQGAPPRLPALPGGPLVRLARQEQRMILFADQGRDALRAALA